MKSIMFLLCLAFCTMLVGSSHGSVGPPIGSKYNVSVSLPDHQSFDYLGPADVGTPDYVVDQMQFSVLDNPVRQRLTSVRIRAVLVPACSITYIHNTENRNNFSQANNKLHYYAYRQTYRNPSNFG